MSMPLVPGSSLGPYQITGHLGSGGMGDVYSALDPKLERMVAIKVISAHLSHEPTAAARFAREAKAVAALSHPNILDIHDFGEHEGRFYAVTELLEGRSFRDLLMEGPQAPRKVRDWAIQIAQGLAVAHERGFVHRDIKPDNLFLLHDGRVKILDFGLAKPLFEPEDSGSAALTGPADPHLETQEGVVMGTVGYMSPEQVRGKRSDSRSDLFSLGVVLLELLSGRHPFRRDTAADTLSSILKDDPFESRELSGGLPPPFERILRRCLEKRPEDRFQHAKDLAFALEGLADRSTAGLRILPLGGRVLRPLAWAGAGLALLLLGTWLGRGTLAPRRPPEPTFHRLTFRKGNILNARFTPSGDTVVYGASWRGAPTSVFSVRVDGSDPRALGIDQADVLAVSSRGELALLKKTTALNAPTGSGILHLHQPGAGTPRPLLERVVAADFGPGGKALAVIHWKAEAPPRVAPTYVLEYPLGTVISASERMLQKVRVSPDGSTLAVLEWDDTMGNGRILAIDTASRRSTLLAEVRAVEGVHLAWHPKSGELWYSAMAGAARTFELWAVAPGGRPRLLRRDSSIYALHDVSRDGVALLERAVTHNEIHLHDLRSGERKDLSWTDMNVLVDLSHDGRAVLSAGSPAGQGTTVTSYFRPSPDVEAMPLGEGKVMALSPDKSKATMIRASDPGVLLIVPLGAGLPQSVRTGLASIDRTAWFPGSDAVALAGTDRQGRLVYRRIELDNPDQIIDLPPSILVRPDGRSLLGVRDGRLAALDLQGKVLRTYPAGLAAGERVLGGSGDGGSVFTATGGGLPLELTRLDLATGRRQSLGRVPMVDLDGVFGLTKAVVTPSASHLAYSLNRTDLSDLVLMRWKP